MKKVAINELLTWAFTEELCKEGAGPKASLGPAMIKSAWSAMSEVETLGTVVDRSPNGFGVIPAAIDLGEPHEDALKVAEAVRALTKEGFDIPDSWQPFPEWDDERGLIAAEVARVMMHEKMRGQRRTGRHAYNLIVTCAVLKHGPDWHAERPAEQMIMRQGKPAWFMMKRMKDSFGNWREYEVDGYDRKAQRPRKGAYRKYELAEPLRGAIIARIDWLVWRSALKLLERELAGQLTRSSLLSIAFDSQPWNIRQAVKVQVTENA
ncbi:hypothetical protein FJU08_17500 [Martelella alba]|uniref:Uncharacterized protein n=1 Tax=Martelella alba TaxID=2590451 RepID=A0A506U7K8_9HYPH|nr:hypothetical protein [Martelella alba]TPW28599.1 hypothetical protein FJU08_17500 [Martelella alba]